MSSNVPTNEQNAATGNGSDTDSISSLSSRAANMNLDRSSPAPLLSSEASDEEGDTTVVKDDSISEEGPDEDGQMPFLDKYGEVSLPSRESVFTFLSLYSYTQTMCLGILVFQLFHNQSCTTLSCNVLFRLMYPALVKCFFLSTQSSLMWFQSCACLNFVPSPHFPVHFPLATFLVRPI